MPVWPDAWPNGVVVADIDGDGRDDAIVETTRTDQDDNPDADFRLFIFHQLPDGNLDRPFVIAYTSTKDEGDIATYGIRKGTAIAATDLNGDGIADIVLGRRLGLSILYGRRDRAYEVQHVANATGAPQGDDIVFMDADDDGYLDIVAHNDAWGPENDFVLRVGITVYFGAADHAYTRQKFTASESGYGLRTGDFNNDGITDLAMFAGWNVGTGIQIRFGDGTGGFPGSLFVPQAAGLLDMNTFAVGDFTGSDGLDDLVMAGNDANFSGGKFFLFEQTGNGFLSTPGEVPSAAPKDTADVPDKSITADVNGDGRDDLLVVRSGGMIGYFEQRDGRLVQELALEGPYATWSGHSAISVGDLDGDGCKDVATANYNYGLVVWKGVGCRGH